MPSPDGCSFVARLWAAPRPAIPGIAAVAGGRPGTWRGRGGSGGQGIADEDGNNHQIERIEAEASRRKAMGLNGEEGSRPTVAPGSQRGDPRNV
jgi:hypothetical protein